jgi:antirestriction protein ArdC
MNINALYESVTNSIIKEMEAGAVPWVKPWKTPRHHGSVMPHNLATGRANQKAANFEPERFETTTKRR